MQSTQQELNEKQEYEIWKIWHRVFTKEELELLNHSDENVRNAAFELLRVKMNIINDLSTSSQSEN
jgi:hypothetical protein